VGDIRIDGFCDERFASVGASFEENFELGLELGASFALAIEGELVVDLWAGHVDLARTRPWQEDSIAWVYSSSKIPVALCGLMLLDRGLIELDAPVARYWPEFAAAGKSGVCVRHLFCHSSGVAGFDPPFSWADVTDWDHAVSRLAAQAPWWEPGTQTGYHGLTFHYLIGELIRRTTGSMPDEFLAREVAAKIDADFLFGLPDSELPRLAEPDRGEPRVPDRESFRYRAVGALMEALPMADPRWRSSPSTGVGNARSLVKLGSVLACDGSLYGHELMSEETVRNARREHVYMHDPFLGAPVRRGLGFGLASAEFPLPFPDSFHWGGYGGSSVIMEPERKACWSYVPTRLDPALIIDDRGTKLIKAACIGLLSLDRDT